MNSVKISKNKLLAKLKENREDHREIFELALEGWKQEVLKKLEDCIQDARAGKNYIENFYLPMPQDHTMEYNEIIDRVSWHEDDLIELDLRDFNRFVRDCWDWAPDFLNSAIGYSSSSSSSGCSSSSSTISKIEAKLKNYDRGI